MTHYQKLATMIFRIIGVISFIAGLLLFLSSISLSAGMINVFSIFTIFAPHLIGGFLLFVSSKVLAKLVCFDLDEK
ncbi:MAG TPA: hypothetical protein PKY82_31540 [Pyrinomonadaceae bacterium]|nr:hypothetical protein [Pyrinomonadaceae bacterium]